MYRSFILVIEATCPLALTGRVSAIKFLLLMMTFSKSLALYIDSSVFGEQRHLSRKTIFLVEAEQLQSI